MSILMWANLYAAIGVWIGDLCEPHAPMAWGFSYGAAGAGLIALLSLV
jgi:hypothetical protein